MEQEQLKKQLNAAIVEIEELKQENSSLVSRIDLMTADFRDEKNALVKQVNNLKINDLVRTQIENIDLANPSTKAQTVKRVVKLIKGYGGEFDFDNERFKETFDLDGTFVSSIEQAVSKADKLFKFSKTEAAKIMEPKKPKAPITGSLKILADSLGHKTDAA